MKNTKTHLAVKKPTSFRDYMKPIQKDSNIEKELRQMYLTNEQKTSSQKFRKGDE
jgi:hypothetical protein|nr:MAG TPA: hypothetical protein [Caudoviricetes sp.]